MLRKTLSLLGTLLTAVLVVGVIGAAVAWKVQGLRYVPILTGSMAPGMPQGALAVTKPIPHQAVREGMVIAFMPPDPWKPKDGNPVVHRVWRITKSDYGNQLTLETKGDHNDATDPWKIHLNSGIGTYAEVATSLPKAGTVAMAVNRIGPIGLASALLGLFLTAFAVRQLRATARYRSADRRTAGPAPR
ncbi:signal peptidase I [Streptomyces sp. cg36]|uniref:signal peptidase I n=1 Tax=Streptomyces sp. cg36 TaxID=3238798 RepID=UPI0034E2C471